jgi:hypothetical protein
MRFLLVAGAVLAVPIAAPASNTPTSAVYRSAVTKMSCGIAGKVGAADPVENALKNRIAPVPSASPMTMGALRSLPVHDKAPRATWSAEDLTTFKGIEDKAISIIGYIVRVRAQGAETTNCLATAPTDVDFHVSVVDDADKAHLSDADHGLAFSGVVEITPRWRQANPAWTLTALQQLVIVKMKVRITGWALFDYEHPEQLPQNNPSFSTRSTLWEIHPVTKIEYATSGGRWVELGASTSASRAHSSK